MGGASDVGKGVVSRTASLGVNTTTGVLVGVGISVGVTGIGSLTGVDKTGCVGGTITEISPTIDVGVI